MLLRQLEYLVALGREGHFGRAAESCWVSQPTLSAGIRKLEVELGFALVRRGHRYEGLTPDGEVLLAWAQRVLIERDDLFANGASNTRAGLSGQLRIAAIPTSLPPITMLTEPFCTAHPGVDVVVASQPSSEILRRLRTFEVDAGLMYLGDSALESMDCLPLYEERYLLLTPAAGPLSGRSSVSWEEAAGVPLCLLTPEMENRQILDRAFAEVGMVVEPQIETNAISVLGAHVATGRWSSIVSQSWLSLFGERASSILIPIDEPQPLRPIGIVTAPRHTRSTLTRAFLEIARHVDLRSAFARDLP